MRVSENGCASSVGVAMPLWAHASRALRSTHPHTHRACLLLVHASSLPPCLKPPPSTSRTGACVHACKCMHTLAFTHTHTLTHARTRSQTCTHTHTHSCPVLLLRTQMRCPQARLQRLHAWAVRKRACPSRAPTSSRRCVAVGGGERRGDSWRRARAGACTLKHVRVGVSMSWRTHGVYLCCRMCGGVAVRMGTCVCARVCVLAWVAVGVCFGGSRGCTCRHGTHVQGRFPTVQRSPCVHKCMGWRVQHPLHAQAAPPPLSTIPHLLPCGGAAGRGVCVCHWVCA